MKQKNKSIYQQIKEQNGERFAQYIRKENPAVFDVPNIVFILKYAGTDASMIIEYLSALVKRPEIKPQDSANPLDLLDKAGYNAIVVDTLEKQNAIKKYFSEKEKLCTFDDDKRYIKNFIVHAIKKNVDEIKREDFLFPQRQDEYGTSVISIQIDKKMGYITITNRYNSTVNNPDNTFDSNPDNIMKGLTSALFSYAGIKKREYLRGLYTGYYLMENGQIFHYKREMNNVYIGQEGYVIKNKIYPLRKDYQILLDNMFILDLKEKKVFNPAHAQDSFPALFSHFLKDKKLKITGVGSRKKRLYANEVPVMDIVDGFIVALRLPGVQKLDDYFLRYNTQLKKIYAADVREMGANCFEWNEKLKGAYMPQIAQMGENFNDEQPVVKRLIDKVCRMQRQR